MILSIQEEGIASKWLMIIGILTIFISIATEVVMTFLRGSMNVMMLLDFPTMIWYFGWMLIIFGLIGMIKNFILPPAEKRLVEEKFKVKLLIFAGLLCLLLTLGMRLFLKAFKTGCMTGIMAFSMGVSFPRLCMLIGGGIFLIGILMSIKYLFGLFLRVIWPFKRKRYI